MPTVAASLGFDLTADRDFWARERERDMKIQFENRLHDCSEVSRAMLQHKTNGPKWHSFRVIKSPGQFGCFLSAIGQTAHWIFQERAS